MYVIDIKFLKILLKYSHLFVLVSSEQECWEMVSTTAGFGLREKVPMGPFATLFPDFPTSYDHFENALKHKNRHPDDILVG